MAVTKVETPTEQLRQYSTVPKLIPATIEDVFSSTCFLEEIVLTNPSAADVEVTVADKQDTPCEILKVDVPSKGYVHAAYKARYAPGGVTWVAASAAVVGFVRARY